MVEGSVHLDRAGVYDLPPEQAHPRVKLQVEVPGRLPRLPPPGADVSPGAAGLLPIRDHPSHTREQADNLGNILHLEEVSLSNLIPSQSHPQCLHLIGHE